MFAQCSLFLLLTTQAQALGTLDKVQVERAVEFEEAQIKALEAEIASAEATPNLSIQKSEEALEEPKAASNVEDSSKKEGVTLMISVTEDDVDQLPLRLTKLIKAQNHKFSGGAWLVYDNDGAKPSVQMREVMEKAMSDKHVDGWMEVDYSQEAMANLHQKVGMRFVPNTPKGNLAHFWMMDQCETQYCAHYDLNVVSFAQEGYSWVDRGMDVLKENENVMQVVSSIPSNKNMQVVNVDGSAGISSLLQTASGAGYTSTTCDKVMTEAHKYEGKRFITGRMYLMHKQRYERLFPISGTACRDSSLRWEEVASCESCRQNLKRANLNEADRGWHLEFQAPAGPLLEKALGLVESGVAVTSKLLPHRAANLQLWEMESDFEALHPSF